MGLPQGVKDKTPGPRVETVVGRPAHTGAKIILECFLPGGWAGQKIAERFNENFLLPPMTGFASVLYLRIWVLGCSLKLAAFGLAI